MSSPQKPHDPGDTYGRALELFSKALGLSEEERQAFLDRECGADAQMRAEVESLLAHDAEVVRGGEEAEARAHRGVLGALAQNPTADADIGGRVPEILADFALRRVQDVYLDRRHRLPASDRTM